LAATSPPLPPLALIAPLTVRSSSLGVRSCERIAPLTVLSVACPACPRTVMPPLTVLACNLRRSTSATSSVALTVPACSSLPRGTRSSSTAPRLLRLLRGYTTFSCTRLALFWTSRRWPSPRLPVSCTSLRSQPRTFTEPAMLLISTRPPLDSG